MDTQEHRWRDAGDRTPAPSLPEPRTRARRGGPGPQLSLLIAATVGAALWYATSTIGGDDIRRFLNTLF